METSQIIAELNRVCRGSFIDSLGIVFTSTGEGKIEATMPVADKLQPIGILHGGASLALAETVASAGSYLLIDPSEYFAYGLHVSGNHVGQVSEGTLYARAEILHQGKNTHIWDVRISNEQGKQICVSRVTVMVVKKENGGDAGNSK